jgi:hypothetical protein
LVDAPTPATLISAFLFSLQASVDLFGRIAPIGEQFLPDFPLRAGAKFE